MLTRLCLRSTRVAARRWCGNAAQDVPKVHPVGVTLESPLTPEQLERHQNAERKWMAFSTQIEEARDGTDDALLEVIDGGLAMSTELGEDLRRPGYDANLHLEAAVIYEKKGALPTAVERCLAAEAAYVFDKDVAGCMQAKCRRAELQLHTGEAEEAASAFLTVQTWSETDGRKGTPMMQVVAEKLSPQAKLGLAGAKVQLGAFEEAHTLLGEVLPKYASGGDAENTWTCLEVAEACFRGLDDATSVKKTVERQVNWAKRFKMDARLDAAEKRLAECS
eukprot:TRINITY_DN30353_c0_g1_i1.p1 TRINITY_DN30353_c0_g1~~TRINITY_DN30353_c0_g1_i1.p1  ORF type:complete len:278 (+),score=128.76 TRINITY_DN30353_c0_g1_i1:50-883(+)